MAQKITDLPKGTRLTVYAARERNGKTYWTRAGAAFVNKDGQSLNILLDVLPMDGKLTISAPNPKDEAGDAEETAPAS
jgi:hypothetical protein